VDLAQREGDAGVRNHARFLFFHDEARRRVAAVQGVARGTPERHDAYTSAAALYEKALRCIKRSSPGAKDYRKKLRMMLAARLCFAVNPAADGDTNALICQLSTVIAYNPLNLNALLFRGMYHRSRGQFGQALLDIATVVAHKGSSKVLDTDEFGNPTHFPGNLYEQAEAFLRSFKGAFTQAACRAVVPTPDRQKETSPCARFAAAHCHDGKGVLFLYGGATSRSVEQAAGEGPLFCSSLVFTPDPWGEEGVKRGWEVGWVVL
jgi:hypothetical protein